MENFTEHRNQKPSPEADQMGQLSDLLNKFQKTMPNLKDMMGMAQKVIDGGTVQESKMLTDGEGKSYQVQLLSSGISAFHRRTKTGSHSLID
jgi:hypothetical protein